MVSGMQSGHGCMYANVHVHVCVCVCGIATEVLYARNATSSRAVAVDELDRELSTATRVYLSVGAQATAARSPHMKDRALA